MSCRTSPPPLAWLLLASACAGSPSAGPPPKDAPPVAQAPSAKAPEAESAPELDPVESASAAETHQAESVVEAADSPPAPLPEGTTVLHIGDSFAGALGYELNKELDGHGVKGIIKYEKSTYIPTWAWKKEVNTYLWKYKPDLVLITLGGNELGIAQPEQRAENIQRLVRRFDGIPCVWIGIPLWEGANPTLMRVIEENSSPCLFLDSHALLPDLERAKDNIHPSLSARTRWAQTVVDWLKGQRRSDGEKPWSWKLERPVPPAPEGSED